MREKQSALNSEYVIDGIARKLTPAMILDDCLAPGVAAKAASGVFGPIIDETIDPSPVTTSLDDGRLNEYIEKTSAALSSPRKCPVPFAGPYAKSRVAKALIDAIWLNGRFRLCDLELVARWRWNTKALGNMAAFYSSVEEAAEYVGSLGISLRGYSFSENESCEVGFKVGAAPSEGYGREDDDDDCMSLWDTPFGSEHPVMGRKRMRGSVFEPDPESWIIYIPFDTCDYRLGGSALCDAIGVTGGTFPEISDVDYFMDCHELVREFVEDNVVVAGETVSDGGLIRALESLCEGEAGASVNLSSLMSAYGLDKVSRTLFSEVPGALIQIRDKDYDYVDAECLLQDIAYYPLGHPVPGSGKINIKSGSKPAISDILESLLNGQASEGED